MSRFFFHLASKDNTICDEKGFDFNDLAAAHHHAMMMIYKMTSIHDIDWRGWSIKVTDASHRSLLSVLFPQSHCHSFTSPMRRTDCDTVGR